MPTADEEAGPESVSQLQVYAGYGAADLDLLRSMVSRTADIAADHYIDGFGVKTLFACVPFASAADFSRARLTFPVPDDGFHAEAIEYLALADCLHRAGSTRLCVAELGAGWGPWIALAGVLALRRGVADIALVGAEASLSRFALMGKHLAANRLRPEGVSTEDALVTHECATRELKSVVLSRLFNGAVWTHNGLVGFPDTEVTDMATAASEVAGEDYRGFALRMNPVPSRTLDTLLGDLAPVDLLHIDIQGAELDLMTDGISWLSGQARSVFVATHDRLIEGRLIELMLRQGWVLEREKPCRVDWALPGSLTARTTHDGGQYWVNPRLRT